jgi:hypothetical protein
MSIFNLIHSLFDRNVPRIHFIDQGTLSYKKFGKSFNCNMEFTSDGIDLYFGEIRRWEDGSEMSSDERSMIKFDIEKKLPGSWNIGWR